MKTAFYGSRRHLAFVIIGLILTLTVTIPAAAQPRDEKEDTTIYVVVVNHEEQYSIWPAHKELPLGWTDIGKKGTKTECLAYIKEVWTDMRPLSLRKKMVEIEREKSKDENAAPQTSPTPETAPQPSKPEPKPTVVEPRPTEESALLDAEAVSSLLEELKGEFSEFIDDEGEAAKINDKWAAREDLAGQTKKRILELLFEDVKSVIADEEVRKAIWSSWNPDESRPDANAAA